MKTENSDAHYARMNGSLSLPLSYLRKSAFICGSFLFVSIRGPYSCPFAVAIRGC